MLLPSVKVKWVSDHIGYGLFASEFIAKGTITFVQDSLDIVVDDATFRKATGTTAKLIDRYSYLDRESNRIISWDFGKYMNHCCFANTLSTGYGFEIAVQDIRPGEEITDDYGLFTIQHEMQIQCSKKDCLGKIAYDQSSQRIPYWDEKVKEALAHFRQVPQPLLEFIEPDLQKKIDEFLVDQSKYQSVATQIPPRNN